MRCTPGIEVGVVLSTAYLNCLDFRSEGESQSKSGEATIKSRQQYPTTLKLSRMESTTPEIPPEAKSALRELALSDDVKEE